MENNKGLTSSSLFTTLLLVAFIVLKLCKVINWSWWWVLSPIWIPIIFALISLIFLIISKLFEGENTVQENKPSSKSKWQERLEEMQKLRKQQQHDKQ